VLLDQFLYLLEVDIGCQVQAAYVLKDLRPVLDQAMLFDSLTKISKKSDLP
jgi:hypothetical protein